MSNVYIFCSQVFDNEDSFGLAVFRLEENKLNLFQEFPIPKVVTSNIIKVREEHFDCGEYILS